MAAPRPLLTSVHGLPPPGTCRLPNGLRVRYVSQGDVKFLWKEIREDRVQLQHGIQIGPGDVVLDAVYWLEAGANIGLFALYAAELVGPSGLVIAAEPLPTTFSALEANVQAHRQWCSEHSVLCSPVTVLNVGIGDGSTSTATFTLYKRAAGWGTLHPDEAEVLRDMMIFLDNALDPGRASGVPSALSAPARLLGTALRQFGPRGAYEAVSQWAVLRMLGPKQLVECRLRTVSDLISDHSLTNVGLLKVDVERAELEVLRGVAPSHWPLVRQAVLEVHEANLPEVADVLRHQAGFEKVVVEQAEDLRGTSLHMVYALRE